MTVLQQKRQTLNARFASATLTGSTLQGPDYRMVFQSSTNVFQGISMLQAEILALQIGIRQIYLSKDN